MGGQVGLVGLLAEASWLKEDVDLLLDVVVFISGIFYLVWIDFKPWFISF